MEVYGGAQPYGAWARASRETGIEPHYLSYLSRGKHQAFSIDRLLHLADQLGMSVTIQAK